MPVKIEKCSDPSMMRDVFSARAEVFCERLGWEVEITELGELDEIDFIGEPIYFNYFSTDGDQFLQKPASPSHCRWECSRFFIKKQSNRANSSEVTSALFAALCKHCLHTGIRSILASYSPAMRRIYARLGWEPRSLTVSKPGFPKAEIGIWRVSDQALRSIRIQSEETLARSQNCNL